MKITITTYDGQDMKIKTKDNLSLEFISELKALVLKHTSKEEKPEQKTAGCTCTFCTILRGTQPKPKGTQPDNASLIAEQLTNNLMKEERDHLIVFRMPDGKFRTILSGNKQEVSEMLASAAKQDSDVEEVLFNAFFETL